MFNCSRPLRTRRSLIGAGMSLLLLFVTLTAAIAQEGDTATGETTANNPAIRVEDRTVSRSEYERKVNRRLQQLQQRLRQMARARGSTTAKKLRSDTERLRERVHQQVKNQEVTRLLLQVHADRAGITVSDTDVDEHWRKLADRAGSEEALVRKIEEMGQGRESFRRRLSNQIRIQRFVDQNVTEPSVSDTEVEQFYRQNEDQLGERSLKEMRPRIRQQIKRQKKQRATRELIRTLRERSDVVVNV